MRLPSRRLLAAVAALLLWGRAEAAPDAALLATVEARTRRVAEAASPKTCAIRIEQGGSALGFGSGAVVSPEGLVLTCAHVTESAEGGRMVAIFPDGREVPLAFVASNARNDLALCRLDPAGKGLPHFDLAAADPALGQWVVALGHPGGPYADRRPTVAVGKVTGVRRQVPLWLEGKAYVDAIQTDAPIYGGNSGGPLVDLDGRLVGVNGAILPVGDAAFAIPLSRIAKDLPALREGKAVEGERIRDLFGSMGALAEEVDPNALAEAFADTVFGNVLKFLVRLGDTGEPRPKPAAARRLDDLRAAWPAPGASRCVALEKGGTRVGYACLLDARGGARRYLTCARIVGDGKALAVPGATAVPVRVVGRSGGSDVALLEEVRAAGTPSAPALSLAAPAWATDAVPGAWAFVAGPGGAPLEAGVVAAVDREVEDDRRVPTIGIARLFRAPNTSPFRSYPPMTQIDAPLRADQFGGPVVRPDGAVIGIAVAHFHRGVTFVTPHERVRALLPLLEAGLDEAPPAAYDPAARPRAPVGPPK